MEQGMMELRHRIGQVVLDFLERQAVPQIEDHGSAAQHDVHVSGVGIHHNPAGVNRRQETPQ
jgi:hypothetical protein